MEQHSIRATTGTYAITSSGPYVNGKKQGEWVERWENGCLKARGAYEDGSPQGLWSYWNVDGTLGKVARHKPAPRH